MILTDKAREDFSYKYNMSNFNEYSEVVQNALIVDFFDSAGIWSNVVNDMLIIDMDYFANADWYTNIKLLINIANEIYNEKHK